MMSGVAVGKMNKTAVKRWLSTGTERDYRDPQYPSVRLRARGNRQSASVYLVLNEHGKTSWRKLGAWPLMCLDTLLVQLPKLAAERAVTGEMAVDQFTTVGGVLSWYSNRVSKLGKHSKSWRANVKSLVAKHLVPKVGALELASLKFDDIDHHLVMPMVAEGYAQNYIREAVNKLRAALSSAAKARVIATNPLAGYSVSDAVGTTVTDTRLFDTDLDGLFGALRDADMPSAMMFVLMMMFGTRINETRQVRWEHLAGGHWVIPGSNTKSGQEHKLPLTMPAQALVDHYRRWQLKHLGKRAWLFPGRDIGPISIRTAQYRSEVIRFKHFTSHDLRKLMRTIVADMGVDTMIGERLVNHSLPKLLQTYVKSTLDKGMATALEQYHGYLIERGFSQVAAEIIPRSSVEVGSVTAPVVSGWV